MSDSKSTYGEPVEEPRAVDDVVGSAHEGIADAEAARRDAVVADEPVHTSPAADKSRVISEPMVDEDPEFNSAMYEAHADDAGTRSADAPAKQVVTPAETVAVTPSEPVAETLCKHLTSPVSPHKRFETKLACPALAGKYAGHRSAPHQRKILCAKW